MSKNQAHNVTAVIPCYNDGMYIKEAVRSLLDQTLPPAHIIIVDDGSDHATAAVLDTLKSDVVQVIYQNNKGVCAARNHGIAKAETAYILTLDADDLFAPSFVEKAVDVLLNNPETGVVCCYYTEFGEGSIQTDIIKPSGGSSRDFLVKNNGIASALFRTICWKEVGGYDEAFNKGYEDWDFWLSILSNDWTMKVLEDPLFFYRKKKTSRDQTAVSKYDYELRLQLFEKHKDLYTAQVEVFAQQVLWKYSNANKQLLKIKNAQEYRLGHALLHPFKRIKKLFS